MALRRVVWRSTSLEVSEYKKGKEMEGFDPCHPLNEPMDVPKEVKQACSAVFGHLISACQNVLNYVEELSDQRDELNLQVQAGTADRQHLILVSFVPQTEGKAQR